MIWTNPSPSQDRVTLDKKKIALCLRNCNLQSLRVGHSRCGFEIKKDVNRPDLHTWHQTLCNCDRGARDTDTVIWSICRYLSDSLLVFCELRCVFGFRYRIRQVIFVFCLYLIVKKSWPISDLFKFSRIEPSVVRCTDYCTNLMHHGFDSRHSIFMILDKYLKNTPIKLEWWILFLDFSRIFLLFLEHEFRLRRFGLCWHDINIYQV